MMENYKLLGLAWFILIFLQVGFSKAIRDIILFRFEYSILSDLPAWIRNFLLGKNRRCRVCDGFHLTDGVIIQLPALFLLALLNPLVFGLAWWWIFPQWAAFFLLFYLAWFNPLYHYILIKPEFRGRKLKNDYQYEIAKTITQDEKRWYPFRALYYYKGEQFRIVFYAEDFRDAESRLAVIKLSLGDLRKIEKETPYNEN